MINRYAGQVRLTRRWSFLFGFALAVIPMVARAQETDSNLAPEQMRFFESKIRPALVEHCERCHSTEGSSVRGGLAVDSREGLRGGGQSGPAIVPGNLEDSLLWTAINHEDFEMPPGRKMPDEVLEDFRQWILMGAPDPRVATIAPIRSSVSDEDIDRGREFWAYSQPQKVVAPTTAHHDWARTEVDQFVLATAEQAGLSPAEDASADSVLRRLHFDLIGLPPEVDRIAAFTAAHQTGPEQAIADEVDYLLSRPEFGERWGRHWLDVARYGESSGKEIELTFPHAWRYRDWVIDSFNQDKPYDQFIREQVAGDLISVDTDEAWAKNLIATSFLAMGPKTLSERNPRQFDADQIDEQIDVTTRAFLGISVACARCHDHKFDPIPQADYYALAGIFQSTETYFGGLSSRRLRQSSNLLILPVEEDSENQITREEAAELRQQLAEQQQETSRIEAELLRAMRQGNRDQAELQRLQIQARAAERDLVVLQEKANRYAPDGRIQSFCMGVQDAERPVNAKVLIRGEINQPTTEVPRGYVRILGLGEPIPSTSSGRLQFANWLADRENPLTARVMVNRIWLHLMGRPIVAETDNFGMSGQPPSHPELLDNLAVRFMEQGWSVKQLIKEIATSRVYQLSSQINDETLQLDPENVWFMRGSRRRLEAEAIRDAMLAVSGNLQTERPYGSLISEVGTTLLGPGGLAQTNGDGRIARPQSVSEFTAEYRSVYLPIARNAVPRSLEVFDFPDPSISMGQREESNTATQSLYLLNNEFVIEQAQAFARRISTTASSPRETIEKAFQIAYGRKPTQHEVLTAATFLRQVRAEERVATPTLPPAGGRRPFARALAARRGGEVPSTDLDALTQFCQSLLASAEFRYLN